MASIKKTVLASLFAFAALAAPSAKADIIEQVNMTFQSGATFSGDVSFANDFSSFDAVTGTLTGGPYGTDSINWVWSGNNFSTGADNFSNWLMDGSNVGYTYYIQFAYNYADAPTLNFTSGVSYNGDDNYINYSDPLVSGNISSVPEPASMALLGVGMIGTAVMARRRRQSTTTLTAC